MVTFTLFLEQYFNGLDKKILLINVMLLLLLNDHKALTSMTKVIEGLQASLLIAHDEYIYEGGALYIKSSGISNNICLICLLH